LRCANSLKHLLALIGQLSPGPSYSADALPVIVGYRGLGNFLARGSALAVVLHYVHGDRLLTEVHPSDAGRRQPCQHFSKNRELIESVEFY
jgi:hypothetical protein